MTICEFIIDSPPSVVAVILTACGYALQKEISLFAALNQLGFCEIDTSLADDVSSNRQLASIAMFSGAQLLLKSI